MEGSTGLKHKHLEFTLATVSELSSSSVCSSSSPTPVIARFSADGGVTELRFHQDSEFLDGFNVDLGASQVRKESDVWFLRILTCDAKVKKKEKKAFLFGLVEDYICLWH